jgi:hypothetical protein
MLQPHFLGVQVLVVRTLASGNVALLCERRRLCSADFRRLLSRCACFISALADRSNGKPSHSHVSVRATLLCLSASLQFGVQVRIITAAG